MKINVLTLFPEMLEPVLHGSMLGKAEEKGILEFNLINIRDFSKDKHNKADDYPFGGGVGMVMMAQPIFDCLGSLGVEGDARSSKEKGDARGSKEMGGAQCSKKGCSKVIYMSPRGKVLTKEKICEIASWDEVTILCGHYEGVDQRVIDHFGMEEISIGDYVLTGGEIPAMVLIDAVARFVPGVLGTQECATEESIYSGLLECPQYTKPREFEGMAVPEVLTNGNHKLIHLWNYEESLMLTRRVRPDLFEVYAQRVSKGEIELTKDEKKVLNKILEME